MQVAKHHATVVSTRPLVLTGSANAALNEGGIYALAARLHDRRLYFLNQLWWTRELPEYFQRTVQTLARLQSDHPLHRYFVMCNTEAELRLFRSAGVASAHINHNIFVDDGVFDVDRGADKRYDAVSNAALVPFKRVHLSAGIPRLALIFGDWHKGVGAVAAYQERLRRELAHADFLNQPAPGDPWRMLPSSEVATVLNRARVGLCLSAEEGASVSSMEYMLCGLPIVSTPSIGGRDVFFDDRYCRIVPPEENAVALAVGALIDQAIPAMSIRAATLARLAPQRERFIRLVQTIYDRESCPRRFTEEWPAFLRRARQTWRSPDELLGMIAAMEPGQDPSTARPGGSGQ